jgi:NADPH:quinone reductase-like Zn-dependent oxidoreductase
MDKRINFGKSSGGDQGQSPSVTRACRLAAFGSKPPALTVENTAAPEPGADEVLVRMLAAPINPADLNVIEGTYGELPSLPCTIGNEGVGVVERVGASVSGFAVGQTVLPLAFGTWAEQIVVPAESLVALPEGLDPLQAAMLSVNPATAWRMIHDFVKLQPGDWIVQNAANSGVGRSVIQLAKVLGLRSLNVVRRAELIDELRVSGADVVVSEDIDLRTDAITLCGGMLPKLGLNAVGGASALNLANALCAGAPLVTYGAMGRQPLKIPNGLLIFKNISFQGFWLRRWKESAPHAEVRATYEKLADYLAAGVLHTPVHKVFPLDQVLEAIAEATQEKRSGKVLLRMF